MRVALRKESVDRNVPDWAEIARREASLSARRAWIEIGRTSTTGKPSPSLSARRAWIEMAASSFRPPEAWQSLSARRAWIEIHQRTQQSEVYRSLSARRAWIEICCHALHITAGHVALRKESVDRNLRCWMRSGHTLSRSPQGERG